MNPTLELRFKTMIRALTEVIIPALDPANALAQEQARLLVGHLHAALLQLPHVTQVTQLEETSLNALAMSLITASAGGPLTRAATERVQSALAAEDHSSLTHAIEALIADSAADGCAEFLDASRRAVLAHAKTATVLGRSWFKPMGFDSDPASLPAISTLLN